LIGNWKQHLIPTYQPAMTGTYQSPRKKNSSEQEGVSLKVTAKKGRILTQHTGLPPKELRTYASSLTTVDVL
jgi:hypothetical protein